MAKKKKNNWPEWLMHDDGSGKTLTLQEEIVRRMGGRMVRTKKQGCKVLMEIKRDLERWLLEQDEQGMLVPELIEPMDAAIYVYTKGEGHEEEEVGSDGQGGGNIDTQATTGGEPDM